eukprot:jgi/Mesvir1/3397/Mv25886-RA.1
MKRLCLASSEYLPRLLSPISSVAGSSLATRPSFQAKRFVDWSTLPRPSCSPTLCNMSGRARPSGGTFANSPQTSWGVRTMAQQGLRSKTSGVGAITRDGPSAASDVGRNAGGSTKKEEEEEEEEEEGAAEWSHDKEGTLLDKINQSTKYAVASTAFVILLYQHDVAGCWWFVGSAVNVALCKAIKVTVNQSRPAAARKRDPGMPSSHASSLGYLGTYLALSILEIYGTSGSALAAATVIEAMAAFLTWLRVELGYHTWPQVLVGGALGSLTAVLWKQLGDTRVLPTLSPEGEGILYFLSALFLAIIFAKERRPIQRRLQRLLRR